MSKQIKPGPFDNVIYDLQQRLNNLQESQKEEIIFGNDDEAASLGELIDEHKHAIAVLEAAGKVEVLFWKGDKYASTPRYIIRWYSDEQTLLKAIKGET